MADNDIQTRENQWFRKQERHLLDEARVKREARLERLRKEGEKAELEKLRAAHWMKCPKCGHDMKATPIEGVDLEQCTFCGGVYLDRNELDGLLLRKTEQRFKFYRRFFGLD